MSTNFNDTLPVAPTGGTNVKWQTDGSGNDSAYAFVPSFSADTGAADAYVITGVPDPIVGTVYFVLIANTNTTASTLMANAGAPTAITKNGTTPLAGGELVAGAIVIISWDGTQFQLVGKY
jgi:hypothetical protein